MRRSEDIAEALAYVDACLSPNAAADFERQLDADPDLRRQVETWRKQNLAIRKAFESRRTTGDSPVAVRAAANGNRLGVVKAPAKVAPFPLRDLRLTPRPTPASGTGRFARLLGVFALTALILAASATWRPSRTEAFRAEAESAWRAYRGADVWPPLDDGQFKGSPALAAIMTVAWPVPASPAPAQFAFDTVRDGQRFGVLVGDGDGLPAFPPVADAESGTVSAVWSDGRQLIAIVGEGSAADVLAEAQRLARP